MDGQEPGREYSGYYHNSNLPVQPQALVRSVPPSTPSTVAYGSYLAPNDNEERQRIPPTRSFSDTSAYSSYPVVHMARPPASVAHPDHVQHIHRIDGTTTSHSGSFGLYPSPTTYPARRPSGPVYGIAHANMGGFPPNSTNHHHQSGTAGTLEPRSVASVAMAPVHTPFPGSYQAETPPSDFSAAHEGVFYAQRRYTLPHPYANSSHAPIRRPASLRHSVRHREGPATPARLRSTRESYSWAQHTGPDIPHSVGASTSMQPQQDFRTLPDHHHPQTPLTDSNDETIEPGTPAESNNNEVIGTPSLAPLRTLEEIHEYFPQQTAQHESLRAQFLEVMNSSWRRMNEKEPDPQALLQFTTKVEERGLEKYGCLIWAEGTECGKKIPRSDRMLEHLRRHVGVRPFTCDCNSEGCPGIFPSKAAMYQHQKNVEPVQCQRCGAQCLRQNLSRHWRSQRCQNPEA